MRVMTLASMGVTVALVLAPTGARSATKTAAFNISAQVVSDCTITGSNLDFGQVGLTSANNDATTTVEVVCTPTTAYTISLDAGTGANSTVATRYMTSGSNQLQYQLFRDSGRTQVWGETVGTDTEGGEGTGVSQTYTVYGRLPTQNPAATGNYTSTVTATIAY